MRSMKVNHPGEINTGFGVIGNYTGFGINLSG
jgi:hypothetical protein